MQNDASSPILVTSPTPTSFEAEQLNKCFIENDFLKESNRAKEGEIKSLQEKLKYEQTRIESLAETLHEVRQSQSEQQKRESKKLVLTVIAFLFMIKLGLFSPVTHRLYPDIGSEQSDSDRIGQVTGFHYQRNSWWGWKKKTFDRIRFVADHGPQYLDDENKWQDVPEEAWGQQTVDDDRPMEQDNRGWHEQ